MDVQEYLTGLKRVTETSYQVFEPYYRERAKHYVYPVFYQSVTQMIMSGGFFYKIFGSGTHRTLAVFKRANIMGNYSCILHIAPISLSGDKADEIAVIKEARKQGFSVKLCPEDLRRYGIPMNLCEPIAGNLEYVYNVNECYAMEGGKFHGFRKQVRKVTRQEGYRHVFGANDDIDGILRVWDEHNHNTREKSQQGTQTLHWKRIKGVKDSRMIVHSVYIDDIIEGFSVIEKLSDKNWALVMGTRNYDSKLNDINRCMHYLDCEIAHVSDSVTVYANIGAAIGIEGLDFEKEKLHPCAHLQIYRFKPTGKSNKETLKKIFQNL
ncbi:MAG: hypothetical protein II401_10950 [Bacteroidales bacterium]|nr:hypothetical protein [Bacteroidales bacterium]